MIIKNFSAEGVFGYLNFNIDFHPDINFLVGWNGSGKTTALKLINALTTPNLKDLIQIPFDSVQIETVVKGKTIKIFSKNMKNHKTLSITGVKESLILPKAENNEFEFLTRNKEKSESIFDDILRSNWENPVIRTLSIMQSPIFLGLERKLDETRTIKGDYYFEREMILHSGKRAFSKNKIINGSLGASLMEMEIKIQDSYKKLRELESEQIENLRNSILLSSFTYNDLPEDMDIHFDRQALQLERQAEIKETLAKIAQGDTKLMLAVDVFFERLTKLFHKIRVTTARGSDELIAESVEWMMNRNQITRIKEIVSIIDKHKSKVDELFKPILDFLNTVNEFYQESEKKIEIDTVGQLLVVRPNGTKCTIEGLSSGERQLLVIFAHVYFYSAQKERQMAFIIDEPEVSLHIEWQERFAKKLFEVNKSTQFILATHSPEIIGYRVDKVVECR